MYRIIGADQKEYGPVSAEDVRRWITEGRANARSLAWRPGEAQWRPLATFPEFAHLFAAPVYVAQTPASYAATPRPATSGMAVAGFIFSLLGVPCCMTILFPILGLVFSIIGYAQTHGHPPRGGRGLALMGIIISLLMLLLALLIWITAAITGNADINQQHYQFNWNT